MNLEEKLNVVSAYSEMEEMRRAGELGMAIMEKIYPWLEKMRPSRIKEFVKSGSMPEKEAQAKTNFRNMERFLQAKANKEANDAKVDEALWYLKLLREQGTVYQPEIRHALDFAIQFIKEER